MVRRFTGRQRLHRKDQRTPAPQGLSGGAQRLLERTKVDQGICAHDRIERASARAHEGHQLGRDQLVVAAPALRAREHLG